MERRDTDSLPMRVDREFRTPITLILAHIEAAMAETRHQEPSSEDLKAAHRNALRLLHLVDGLIALSQHEDGKLKPRIETIDLSERTRAVVSGFEQVVLQAGLELVMDVHDVGRIGCDPEMWDKILLNLLSNALKFTFDGQIRVSLRTGPGRVDLTVADDGIGVPAEELPRLLEGSYQGSDQERGGAGIGLAVVGGMVDALQGTIDASSVVGQGTSFVVSIPDDLQTRLGPGVPRPSGGWDAKDGYIADALRWLPAIGEGETTAAEASTLRVDRPRPFGASRVVVVDPNPDMRALMERIAGDRYQVLGCATVDDALALRGDIHILSDEQFSEGRDKLPPGPKLVTIDRIRFEDGSIWPDADDYLVKPFSAFEVLARIRNILEQYRLRHEAEAAMRQAQRMETIGRLTGGVSHDFSNLLVAALGNLDMAARRVQDAETAHYISNARKAAERGAKLTRHLLAFSQNKEGTTETLNANDAISSMGDLLNRTLGGMIGINLRLGKGIWPTKVDPAQLELAIINLALNARDAMPHGGDITISTENVASDQDYVRISVDDNGEGMPDDVLTRATERYFTTKGEGFAGLGLVQVAEMAQMHGGTMSLSSIEGRGTSVEIRIPRSVEIEATEPASDAELTVQQPLRILLVDDDNGVREVAGTLLQELGHDVQQAIGGREAVMLLERGGFDLLLVDYAMPDMTGVEVAVRARALHPRMQILFATGYADTGALDERREMVLRKPFDIADLEDKISKVMARGPAEKEQVVSLSEFRNANSRS